MDSGVKLTSQHPEGGGSRRGLHPVYSPHPGIHHNGHGRGSGGESSGPLLSLRGDRFPTPIKRSIREGRDTPQTQV